MDLKTKTSTDSLSVQPKTPSKPPKDPVIEALETFMKETENVATHPLVKKKAKLYDTENLLDILGSKTSKSSLGCPTSLEKPKMRVIPKRRKTQEKAKEPQPKKSKSNKPPKKRTAPLRLQYYKIETIPACKWEMCKRIEHPKKGRATRIRYCKSMRTKALVVDIRNDSKIVKTVKVKEEVEVIDLTELEGNSYYMLISFAKQCQIEEMSLEITEEIVPIQYRKPTETTVASEIATVTVPDVRCDFSFPVVDLTGPDEDNKGPLVAVSEKECANAILPIVYQYHKMFQLNQESEQFLEGGTFSKDVGYHLVQTFSKLFVKNINMTRFLQIVASKMEDKYNVVLSTTTVAYYLKTMLEENRHYCIHKLTQFFLKEISYTKQESVILTADFPDVIDLEEEEVLTQDQLQQLADQIKQYHALFRQVVAVDGDVDEEDSDDCMLSWKEDKLDTN